MLWRALAEIARVAGGQPRNATHGRQDKSADCGLAHVVGKIEEFINVANTGCWRFRQIMQEFQSFERHRSDCLGAGGTSMTTRDDDLRVRPGRTQHGNRGGKRPLDLRRRGNARREEGRTYRQQLPLKPGPQAGPGSDAAGAPRPRPARSDASRVVIKARIVRHRGTRFR